MGDYISRFRHIAELTFEQLDGKSLRNCREVQKSMNNLSHINNQDILRGQGGAELFIGGGGREKGG